MVVMLSHASRLLHLPSERHLVTVCGLQLLDVTVGPVEALERAGTGWCPDCCENAASRR